MEVNVQAFYPWATHLWTGAFLFGFLTKILYALTISLIVLSSPCSISATMQKTGFKWSAVRDNKALTTQPIIILDFLAELELQFFFTFGSRSKWTVKSTLHPHYHLVKFCQQQLVSRLDVFYNLSEKRVGEKGRATLFRVSNPAQGSAITKLREKVQLTL